MPQRIRVPFFEPYWLRRDIDDMKRDAEQSRAALERMLMEVKLEQQQRLRTLRASGPWDPRWEAAGHQLTELAQLTVRQLRRYREMRNRIRQLEDKLPPASGIDGWRYCPREFALGLGLAVIAFHCL